MVFEDGQDGNSYGREDGIVTRKSNNGTENERSQWYPVIVVKESPIIFRRSLNV